MGKESRAKLAAPETMLPRADAPAVAMLALMDGLLVELERTEYFSTGDRDIRERRAGYRQTIRRYMEKYNGTFVGSVTDELITKCDRFLCRVQDSSDTFFEDLTDEDLADMERVKANWPQHKDKLTILCPVRLGIFGEGKMEKPWRVVSNADGVYEEYATLPEAISEAEKVLALWREQATDDGEWDEEVEFVEVHLVTHAARIVSRDGDNEDDGVEYGITKILGNELDEELRTLRAELSRLTLSAAESQREVERLTGENGRLRGALARIRDGEYEFVKYHARQVANDALAEAGQS